MILCSLSFFISFYSPCSMTFFSYRLPFYLFWSPSLIHARHYFYRNRHPCVCKLFIVLMCQPPISHHELASLVISALSLLISPFFFFFFSYCRKALLYHIKSLRLLLSLPVATSTLSLSIHHHFLSLHLLFFFLFPPSPSFSLTLFFLFLFLFLFFIF